jgi:hypothetical protein
MTRSLVIVFAMIACWLACNPSTSTVTSPLVQPPNQIRYPKGLFVGGGSGSDTAWLLGSDDIAGITVWDTWASIGSNGSNTMQVNDWSKFDAAFDIVTAWNAANPDNPKYVKMGVNGGFTTPQWVLDDLPDCDENPGSGCGQAHFIADEGAKGGSSMPLPLPWNAKYQQHWADFITALGDRYSENPALVAVSISGPGATSNEIMDPTGTQNIAEWTKVIQLTLAKSPADDSVFVKPWKTAIDLYGASFNKVTLVLTTGASFTPSGLPIFTPGATTSMGAGFSTGPIATGDDKGYCTDDTTLIPNADCATETQILSYFVDPSHGGNNAKATDMDGMYRGCDQNTALGLHGVKLLTEQTQYTSIILGGAAYISGISDYHGLWQGGCGSDCSVSQSFNGVMTQAFRNTVAAWEYDTDQYYIAPLNYLELFPDDVKLAYPPPWSMKTPDADMQTQIDLAATSIRQTWEFPNEPPPPGPPHSPCCM